MKLNLKIYSILFCAVGLLLSCETDDELPGDPIIAGQGSETASLNFESDPFFGRSEAAGYSVTLASSSSDPRQVQVSSREGSEVTNSSTIVAAGSTSADGSITIPNTGATLAYDERGTFSAAIIGARRGEVTVDEDGEEVFVASGGDTVATTSDIATLEYYDQTPAVSATGLSYLYDWENPTVNDFDLEVIDRGFTGLFESSATGSRYESDVFNNTNPDGIYDFYVTVFDPVNTETSADVNSRLFTVDSDGQKTLLEFVIPAGTPTNGRFPVATFTQTTVDGNATYTDISVL
ncbi:hypothetical protein [Dokdonia sp. Hel_I_53]|uniref:hypothetical protein n=1 Tax=Dokdonia sp. Hel_I_53 TaxID=1566287 RepID=UPI00119967BF|nr:hypothetical protein [Dokdonia sp. Hel_I_53]TVZ52060.1 hypothetical protein OD90_1223 [Dokdonia sp. Hel_I_53]